MKRYEETICYSDGKTGGNIVSQSGTDSDRFPSETLSQTLRKRLQPVQAPRSHAVKDTWGAAPCSWTEKGHRPCMLPDRGLRWKGHCYHRRASEDLEKGLDPLQQAFIDEYAFSVRLLYSRDIKRRKKQGCSKVPGKVISGHQRAGCAGAALPEQAVTCRDASGYSGSDWEQERCLVSLMLTCTPLFLPGLYFSTALYPEA